VTQGGGDGCIVTSLLPTNRRNIDTVW